MYREIVLQMHGGTRAVRASDPTPIPRAHSTQGSIAGGCAHARAQKPCSRDLDDVATGQNPLAYHATRLMEDIVTRHRAPTDCPRVLIPCPQLIPRHRSIENSVSGGVLSPENLLHSHPAALLDARRAPHFASPSH